MSEDLLSDLLPGPVTVVFERSPALNPTFNPHTHLIGVRIPDNQFMQQVAKQCDSPIALTSANISGSSSCLYVKVCISQSEPILQPLAICMFRSDPPENCHLNVKKLPKLDIGNFVEKNDNFCLNFLKKMSSFWQFFDIQIANFRRVRGQRVSSYRYSGVSDSPKNWTY